MSTEERMEVNRSIQIINRMESLQLLNAELEAVGSDVGWPERTVLDLSLACEELVVNSINYGFPDGAEHTIAIHLTATSDSVELRIEDGGVPFDPLQEIDPFEQLEMDVDDRPIGGLGIFFVKKLMDEVWYEHKNGKNCVGMRKQV